MSKSFELIIGLGDVRTEVDADWLLWFNTWGVIGVADVFLDAAWMLVLDVEEKEALTVVLAAADEDEDRRAEEPLVAMM